MESILFGDCILFARVSNFLVAYFVSSHERVRDHDMVPMLHTLKKARHSSVWDFNICISHRDLALSRCSQWAVMLQGTIVPRAARIPSKVEKHLTATTGSVQRPEIPRAVLQTIATSRDTLLEPPPPSTRARWTVPAMALVIVP